MDRQSDWQDMSVLVIGGGGREHALAWKVAHSPRAQRVFVAPGNVGMVAPFDRSRAASKIERVPIAATAIDELIAFAKERGVGLIIPGPEAPLVGGIADEAERAGIRAFGPRASAAMATEGSKCDAKEFMDQYGIPTAPFWCFKPDEASEEAAAACVRARALPVVIKDDGLAGGKGVTVARTYYEAVRAVRVLISRRRRLVVEDFLDGVELTFTCAVFGDSYLPLAVSQDNKLLRGRMTGGMAAVSSDAIIAPRLHQKIVDQVVEPTVRGLTQSGIRYVGFLYFGLMIVAGEPYVLEFNCRIGDSEAQVILIRFWADLVEMIRAGLSGELCAFRPVWNPQAACCLVLAASGYPGHPDTGDPILGLPEAEAVGDVKVFHASTDLRGDVLVTAGGRVLSVTALGPDVAGAIAHTFRASAKIRWNGMQFLDAVPNPETVLAAS